MVRLLLLRHAKSAHPPGVDDIDRPLCDRGRMSAAMVGNWLVNHAIEPALVLCSTARRCSDTLGLILPLFRTRPELRYRPDLYLAESATLLEAIRSEPVGSPLMLVGHNPGLHELGLAMLSRDQPAAAAERAVEFGRKFPTAALAAIEFRPNSWRSVKAASGILVEFVRPKSLLRAEGQE